MPTGLARGLLAWVTFNLLLGNGDAHSKNYSRTISDSATLAMAPLYGVAPVFLVNPALGHLGHHLNGQSRLGYLTASHLLTGALGGARRTLTCARRSPGR